MVAEERGGELVTEAIEEVDPAQQAAVEGLTLQRAPSAVSGWKGVYRNGNRFAALLHDAETEGIRYLGNFDTAEQATSGR